MLRPQPPAITEINLSDSPACRPAMYMKDNGQKKMVCYPRGQHTTRVKSLFLSTINLFVVFGFSFSCGL